MADGEYRRVAVIGNDGPTPMNFQSVREADLVVCRHFDGTWTVWKDRHSMTRQRQPWDALPAHVKREIWKHRGDE